MSALWRLMWALPLVLAVGAFAALLLKRLLVPGRPAAPAGLRLTSCGSLTLSDDTRVHLIEVDRKSVLIVESARHAVIHTAGTQAGEATRPAALSGSPWLRRLNRATTP